MATLAQGPLRGCNGQGYQKPVNLKKQEKPNQRFKKNVMKCLVGAFACLVLGFVFAGPHLDSLAGKVGMGVTTASALGLVVFPYGRELYLRRKKK